MQRSAVITLKAWLQFSWFIHLEEDIIVIHVESQ